MKKLINPLFIVTLCLITFFSCGDNGTKASIDGAPKTEKLANKTKPTIQPPRDVVSTKMETPSKEPENMTEEERLVAAKTNNKALRTMGEGQAEQSTIIQKRRSEAAKDLPTTEEQKAVANDICACLNKEPLFKTAKKSTTIEGLVESIGEGKNKEVRVMQACYNNKMVNAVKGLGKDAGVFSKKSRKYLTKECFEGKEGFWSSIGGYLMMKPTKPNGK